MLKKTIFSMLLYMTCPICAYSLGCPTSPISVPFTNFNLNNKCSVSASYTFGSINKILFCYVDAAINAGVVNWPYNGNIFSAAMPLQLTISSKYQGYLADSSGTIQVINNTNSAISINCLFAF